MKFTCNGFQPVTAEGFDQAAEIFAGRMARREFGRSSRVGALRRDGTRVDGGMAEFDAFIGRRTGQNQTTGRNVRFSVFCAA